MKCRRGFEGVGWKIGPGIRFAMPDLKNLDIAIHGNYGTGTQVCDHEGAGGALAGTARGLVGQETTYEKNKVL
jgi:hypothetical protein